MKMKYHQSTSQQRCEIVAELGAGRTPNDIADKLRINVITVYREMSRNGRTKGYDAEHAIKGH